MTANRAGGRQPPPNRQSASQARRSIDSIAVLPLVAASDSEDAEYLGDGIAESLINHLAQIERLRVAQSLKAFRYRGVEVDLQRAAHELGVQPIVTGRLLVRGGTLVAKVDLVDVERDAQIWGQQFTRPMSDIFVLQEEIATEVLQALKPKLAGEPKKPPRRRQTHSSNAYHLYLKGRFHWARRTSQNIQKALEYYQQAIELDPTYALAYAGIADCHVTLGYPAWGTMKPGDAFPRAKAAARKALALDESLGEAHASLASCAFWYDWDWTAADEAFRRALDRTPDNAAAHGVYAWLLVVLHRFDEALAFARRATEVDPLSALASSQLSVTLYLVRRYDEAMRAASTAIELDPSHVPAYAYIGLIHLAQGNVSEAISFFEKVALLTQHPHWKAVVGWTYGLAGRRDDALRVLHELTELSKQTYVSPYSFLGLYEVLGDTDRWRDMMRASFEQRESLLVFMDAPWHDRERHDPFFAEIRRTVGLPEP